MSNEKHELYECETVIIGAVVGIDKKTSAAGKEFAVLLVGCEKTYKGETETVVYPITVFGAQLASPDFVLEVGDSVAVTARVTAREYNGKFYSGLTYKSARVTGRIEVNASEPTPAGPVQVEDDAMPF